MYKLNRQQMTDTLRSNNKKKKNTSISPNKKKALNMAVFFFNQTVSLKHMETHVMTHKVTRIRIINIENAFSCDPLFDTSAHKGGEGAPMCFFPTSSLHTSHRLPLPN